MTEYVVGMRDDDIFVPERLAAGGSAYIDWQRLGLIVDACFFSVVMSVGLVKGLVSTWQTPVGRTLILLAVLAALTLLLAVLIRKRRAAQALPGLRPIEAVRAPANVDARPQAAPAPLKPLNLHATRAPHGDLVCPFCKDSIDASRLHATCRKCGTRHHAECFHDNERCAVYGCGERAALVRREPSLTRAR